jgi:hypothetical protein
MKYKLIHQETKKETICEKVVTGDGFEYYVSNQDRSLNDFVLLNNKPISKLPDYNGYHVIQLIDETLLDSANALNCPKVIATNNPNIDIPKVVDEVEKFADEATPLRLGKLIFKQGYSKSQETHPFTAEDMLAFGKLLSKQTDEDGQILNPNYINDKGLFISAQQLLEFWKTKTIFYK